MYSDGAENNPDLSTRVNSARLADYVGKHVRLACKALQVDGDRMMVEASDGGQVNVIVLKNEPIESTYVEIIGRVIDATTVQMLACINMGSDLDMKLVNDTIELIHDPRFYTKMFCITTSMIGTTYTDGPGPAPASAPSSSIPIHSHHTASGVTGRSLPFRALQLKGI